MDYNIIDNNEDNRLCLESNNVKSNGNSHCDAYLKVTMTFELKILWLSESVGNHMVANAAV
jgi:hypothetical protein